jgi:FtsH-binding integral membrane protein
MMVGLFFLFLVAMVLIFLKKRTFAITISVITIFLCVGMLIHHATDVLKVRL